MDDQVTGIVLAGGTSSRLGQNKAFIQIDGQLLIERVVERLRLVVSNIVLVTNTPSQFAFLDVPMAGDVFQGVGALGGLHAGLSAICTGYGLAVGCDMPFLNVDLLRYMISLRKGYDLVIPQIGSYYEPLHAVYARRCLHEIEQKIRSGERRVSNIADHLRVRYVDDREIAAYDPQNLSFFNVNSPQDLERLREIEP
jgi:molybdopterin-guanine dinucleotide biosynthesis protein A